jgi:hypothetical protein
MAQFFPTRTTCRFDTPGERRLAERLEKKLEDDYLCWFNIPVGPKALQPDFVLMHPLRGVLVLEVKDWKQGSIQNSDRPKAAAHCMAARMQSRSSACIRARAWSSG